MLSVLIAIATAVFLGCIWGIVALKGHEELNTLRRIDDYNSQNKKRIIQLIAILSFWYICGVILWGYFMYINTGWFHFNE